MALVKDDVVKKWKIKLSMAPTPFVSVHRHGISFKINVYAIYILKCWLYVLGVEPGTALKRVPRS
jgi:hypothetical protein